MSAGGREAGAGGRNAAGGPAADRGGPAPDRAGAAEGPARGPTGRPAAGHHEINAAGHDVIKAPGGEYVRVARRGDIPPGSIIRVEAGGHAIAIADVDGELFAIDDTCSHEEASLSEGGFTGEVVVCARHGARFNVKTGRVLSLPAVRSVATYAVKVEGDDVLVATEPRRSTELPHRR